MYLNPSSSEMSAYIAARSYYLAVVDQYGIQELVEHGQEAKKAKERLCISFKPIYYERLCKNEPRRAKD